MRFFFSKIVVPAMLVPCLFYFFLFFAVQMVFEVNESAVLGFVGVSEKLEEVGLPKSSYSALAFSDCLSNFGECTSEFGGGIIELFSPVPAYGETMTAPKTDQKSHCSECCMSNYFEEKIIQVISAYILAICAVCGVGTAIGVTALKIYYRFFF